MHFSDQILALLADMRSEAEQTSRETEDHWVRARSLHPDAAQMLSLLSSRAKETWDLTTG